MSLLTLLTLLRQASAKLWVPQWLAKMHTGAELQMLHEGGWWPVRP